MGIDERGARRGSLFASDFCVGYAPRDWNTLHRLVSGNLGLACGLPATTVEENDAVFANPNPDRERLALKTSPTSCGSKNSASVGLFSPIQKGGGEKKRRCSLALSSPGRAPLDRGCRSARWLVGWSWLHHRSKNWKVLPCPRQRLLSYARKHRTHDGENSPVGLILHSERRWHGSLRPRVRRCPPKDRPGRAIWRRRGRIS